MKDRLPPLSIVLVLALTGGGPTWAQEADATEAESEAESDEGDEDLAEDHVKVVVTASKHGQKITEAPAAVTVITSEDIAETGATTVADVFRRVPGMDFAQLGARDFNLNARGFNGSLSRRLLVLVDGRSVYLDLMGFTMWDALQIGLDDISRIEVVRGPGSALYGANASSGVVNIITKSPSEIGGTRATLGYGEGKTVSVGALHGEKIGRFGYKVSASYYSTEPFENPNEVLVSQELNIDTDNGTRQPKGMFRVQHDVGEEGLWLFDAGYSATSGVLFTGIGPLDIQPGSHLTFARTSYQQGNFFTQVFWNGIEGETINLTTTQFNVFETNSYDAEVQYNFGWGKNFFVVGGNARLSDVSTDLASEDHSELLYGFYIQDEIRFNDQWTGNLAVRLDNDELIGTVFAPKGGIVYNPSASHSFRLTFGTAYNSSSFIESYLDWVFSIPLDEETTLDVSAFGNPDLEPERNITYELGYRSFPLPTMMVDATVFYAELEDFVQFIPVEFYIPGLPKTYTYINADEASQIGVELAVDAYLREGIAAFVQYSYTHSDQEKDTAGVGAEHKAGVTFQFWSKTGFHGSLGVHYTSELAYDTDTPFYRAETLPAFTVVNGSISYDFIPEGRLSAGIRGTNLLNDKHREHIAGDIIERRILGEVKIRF